MGDSNHNAPPWVLILVALIGAAGFILAAVLSRPQRDLTPIPTTNSIAVATPNISTAMPPQACIVPQVERLDQGAAEAALAQLGLQTVKSTQYNAEVASGLVLSQDPPAGQKFYPCKGEVVIVVSLGPTPTALPTLTPRPTWTMSDGLVAYYPFNGNALDESENRFHGTVNGATLIADRFEEKSAAYNFDGNDSIKTDIISAHNQSSTQAVSLWFRTANPNNVAWGGTLFYFGGNSRFALAILKHKLQYAYGADDYKNSDVSGAIITDGIWHHVVFVSYGDNGLKQIYVDGTRQTEFTGGNNHNETTGFIHIGGYRSENYFTGDIDDVRWYDRVLSESEILDLYKQ